VVQRKCACDGTGGDCANCQKELQRKAALRISRAPTQMNRKCSQCETDEEAPTMLRQVLRSAAMPLDPASRAYMEPRIGHDLSNVRIHTDAQAAESASAVQALAYTVGSHIVFAADRYRPHSFEGRHLLAHELTHVIQQHGHSSPDSLDSANQMVARAWNECGGPDECPRRIAGERARAAAASLQVGTLDSPEVGEIVSHFAVGSSRVSALSRNPTWTAFVAVITSENSRWEILGFTDCQGDGERNAALRRERAEAVRNLLPAAAQAKIDRAIGAPLSDCVGTNGTELERSLNRSVVFRRTSTEITFPPENVEVTRPRPAPRAPGTLTDFECALQVAQNLGTAWLAALPNCPCTTALVASENTTLTGGNQWSESSFGLGCFHPGAERCFRRDSGGHAQQCCYDATGNLITAGAAAGTPDFVPSSGSGHQSIDVWTWWNLGWERYDQFWVPNNGNGCASNTVTNASSCRNFHLLLASRPGTCMP